MTDPVAAPPAADPVDLLIIGGGINGCGIARDAAGRGLRVALAEMGDLAQATSSASTKLFHGGLRYLEYFEFRLVREALQEREVLLRAMPHISWPMRFVLPYHPDMRFEGETPMSRVMGLVMPWMRGRRPAWLIRLGLFLYDHMGGRHVLPATRRLDLRDDAAGQPLQDRFRTAFEYSDVWVEDSRLVALNARDAAARGATILTRTKVSAARREGALWQVTLTDSISGASHVVRARMLVNAAGPWVRDVIHGVAGLNSPANIRLVRGSHIVVPRFFDHEKCYFLQGTDGRIIFAIPYEGDFTLIGTTDADHPDATEKPVCSPAEAEYLLEFANAYFKQQLTADDIVWTYSGVRPLYDDGASSATAATRDYVLKLDTGQGAPMLNIFGGKITTYRRLAEAALDQIAAQLPVDQPKWTAGVPLPGGDFPVDGVAVLIADLRARFAFLDAAQARRLVRAYGTDAALILDGAASSADLGPDFGAGLTGAEVRWLMRHEFARDAQDILWRRSKLGLRLTPDQVTVLQDWMSMQKP